MNFFRTSGDSNNALGTWYANLQTTLPFSAWAAPLSQPGCWAYPDMLEVGCQHGPGGPSDPGLSYTEARTHFNAWCIVSSPLILSHDMTNDTVSDEVWPIITNTEALGRILYTDFIFYFQAAGLVLLVAMVGAIVLTLRHKEGVKRQNISDQVARTPATAIEVIKVKPGQGI